MVQLAQQRLQQDGIAQAAEPDHDEMVRNGHGHG